METGIIVSSILVIGFACVISWILPKIIGFIEKNAKKITIFLIGLLSLLAAFPLMIPFFMMVLSDSGERAIAMQYAPSLASLIFMIALIFAVCGVAFIALVALCVVTVNKIRRTGAEYNLKSVMATFIISMFISAITVITFLFSFVSKVGLADMTIATIMFSENGISIFGGIFAFLILCFSVTGIVFLKKQPSDIAKILLIWFFNIFGLAFFNKKSEQVNQKLSNRFLLSVVSIVLLCAMVFATEGLFITILGKMNSILRFLAIAGNIEIRLCVVSAIIIFDVVQPSKAQNILKTIFFSISLLYVATTIYYLIIGKSSIIVFFSVVVVALSIVALFLVTKSRIVDFTKEKESKNERQNSPVMQLPNISSDEIAKGAEYIKHTATATYQKTAASYQVVLKRAKQIILSPLTEYQAIEQENMPHTKTFTSYLLPLLLIPVLFAFIGYGLVGYSMYGHHFNEVGWGVRMAIVQIIVLLGSIYLSSFIISMLADNYGVAKNFNRIFSLVAYAFTPMFIAGIFHIHHSLWWLVFLTGFYGLYLIYVGMKPILKPAEEKADTFTIIAFIIPVVSYFVLFLILKEIVLPQGFHFM